jgi:hypothetical protein
MALSVTALFFLSGGVSRKRLMCALGTLSSHEGNTPG